MATATGQSANHDQRNAMEHEPGARGCVDYGARTVPARCLHLQPGTAYQRAWSDSGQLRMDRDEQADQPRQIAALADTPDDELHGVRSPGSRQAGTADCGGPARRTGANDLGPKQRGRRTARTLCVRLRSVARHTTSDVGGRRAGTGAGGIRGETAQPVSRGGRRLTSSSTGCWPAPVTVPKAFKLFQFPRTTPANPQSTRAKVLHS